MCKEQGFMVNDDVNHGEIFNLTDIRDLKVGYINIFALTKGYNSQLKDHFELVLTFFPKPLFNQIGNEANHFMHAHKAWITLFFFVIVIAFCVCGIYYFEIKKTKELPSNTDPYSNSVIER